VWPVNATENDESTPKLPVPECALAGRGRRFNAGS